MVETSGGGAKAALLALMVLAAAVAVVVADDTEIAGAGELAPFSSCGELESWMADAGGAAGGSGFAVADAAGDDASAAAGDSEESAAPTAGFTPTAGELDAAEGAQQAGGTGSTNVIVAGIDELDRVEQLDGDRILAVGERSLHLVDVGAARSLAAVPIPPGAQVSHDPERSLVWVAGSDGNRTTVQRLALEDDAFVDQGTWATDGMLLTGRRTADAFHVVVVEGWSGAVPFGDGPVPCDEVLRPAGPASPEATLITTLPAEGPVVPSAATEVVGAGRFVHLTPEAVFIATELWDQPTAATSIHRFDLATLAYTGSGRVQGRLLNEFSMSLYDGNLRVAVTYGGGRFGVMPMEGDIAADVAVEEPVPVDPGIGGPVPGEPGPPPVPEPGPAPSPTEPLNEVVVLDTDGDLDLVGRSARFGLPGETLQGIRFVGTTAYAVTFLQTDPFYVLDLADPASPRVVGEVKLPGFSSYLHPIAEGFVVGFGPDGEGKVAAKLFDVSDPAAPAVVDTLVLGDESPVVWDYHAFLGMGDGRFAVPASSWIPVEPVGCDPAGRAALEARAIEIEQQAASTTDQAQLDALYRELDTIWSGPCLNPQVQAVTTVVEVAVAGGALDVVSRTEVRQDQPGERVLRSSDAWVLYNQVELVVARDGGEQVPVPLG